MDRDKSFKQCRQPASKTANRATSEGAHTTRSPQIAENQSGEAAMPAIQLVRRREPPVGPCRCQLSPHTTCTTTEAPSGAKSATPRKPWTTPDRRALLPRKASPRISGSRHLLGHVWVTKQLIALDRCALVQVRSRVHIEGHCTDNAGMERLVKPLIVLI